LRRFGLSTADADDAAQRVFVIAAERYDDIAPGSERGFLFRTAMHVASKAHRSARRRLETAEADVGDEQDAAPLADELLDQRRARQLLDRILGEIEPDLAAVIVLFEIEGLTTTEVAEALDVPPGTVASRLRRARAELESHVSRHLARTRFRGVLP
jgi:RNA polymerase sigma-70 factor (ECF subfamily)